MKTTFGPVVYSHNKRKHRTYDLRINVFNVRERILAPTINVLLLKSFYALASYQKQDLLDMCKSFVAKVKTAGKLFTPKILLVCINNPAE